MDESRHTFTWVEAILTYFCVSSNLKCSGRRRRRRKMERKEERRAMRDSKYRRRRRRRCAVSLADEEVANMKVTKVTS